MGRKFRIGIDVGGTFTDAVAIDNETYELIGIRKVPTTHSAKEGVAAGIVQVVKQLMDDYNINPQDVVFIAHGTTQATNALLEGDVVPVGILSKGKGMEGAKVKADTEIGQIELAPGKLLQTYHIHMDSDLPDEEVKRGIKHLLELGAEVIVAAEAFSVDNPDGERRIMGLAQDIGVPATGTHEISKLYGLKVRTTTAVINASILPKMMNTANMTEKSVKETGISAPLMIMRCDGGVMTVNEVRKRPILTMLSGPAAGVAGALMYEKISNGIFLEVGGTSTDISCIKDGKVMVEYAQVGDHKTYLHSLDVRTVGIAGGSMIRITPVGDVRSNGYELEDVGPRSAHIAGLPYAVYADPEEIVNPQLEFVQPKISDPDNYVAVVCENGKRFALTVACAANILGKVRNKDYAYGNVEAARKAFVPLARAMGCTVEEAAKRVLTCASRKVMPVVKELLEQYKLNGENVVLVGGGGGAAAIVPFLAEMIGMEHRISRNAEVISTIGVALAMVREVVERTVPNPTDADILRIRKEAEEAVMKAGAAEGTIEIQIEVDSQKNIVRAIATGATEFRTKDPLMKELADEELKQIAAKAMKTEPQAIQLISRVGRWAVIRGEKSERWCFGLLRKKRKMMCVVDKEGVIRLQKIDGSVKQTSVAKALEHLANEIDTHTTYGDAGGVLPECYLLCGEKLIDLSGLQTKEQILSVSDVELKGISKDTPVAILTTKKG